MESRAAMDGRAAGEGRVAADGRTAAERRVPVESRAAAGRRVAAGNWLVAAAGDGGVYRLEYDTSAEAAPQEASGVHDPPIPPRTHSRRVLDGAIQCLASGPAGTYGGTIGSSTAGSPAAKGTAAGDITTGDGPAAGTLILAGGKSGLFVSTDDGRTWQPSPSVPDGLITSVAVSPADGAWYAGTEPSHVYRSTDAGRTWEELKGLRNVPSRSTWSFPPRPWTHHVSALAPHPTEPATLVAGIELGGVMLTTDGGKTFRDHPGGIHRDSHMLIAHGKEPGTVYLGAGEGAAFSRDGGATWTNVNDGLEARRYVTAIGTDPEDPGVLLAGASPSASVAYRSDHARARLFRLQRYRGGEGEGTAGGPWETLSGQAPGLPGEFDSAIRAIVPHKGGGFTVALLDGSLWRSGTAGRQWMPVTITGDTPPRIRRAVGS